MSTLFLDLGSHDGSVAVVTADATLAHSAVDHRLRDHDLLPLIEDTVRGAGLAMRDLAGVACVAGPGGFTSLRVAVACANALSWELKVPLRGLHLSDLVRARHPEGDLLWLHSTQKATLFARGFGSLATQWPEAAALEVAALQLPPGAAWAGELIDAHKETLHAGPPATLKPLPEVLPGLLAGLTPVTGPLEVWYGRGW